MISYKNDNEKKNNVQIDYYSCTIYILTLIHYIIITIICLWFYFLYLYFISEHPLFLVTLKEKYFDYKFIRIKKSLLKITYIFIFYLYLYR